MHEKLIYKMKKLNKAMMTANDMLNNTVKYARREVLEEAVVTLTNNPQKELVLFGVKNTNQISREIVESLRKVEGFLFHTVDKMSERGRAIDIDLINPLTGRVMTGSSSGGCVNILRGINDIAIGTDGGGSVLAPAISTGLYSIMGKGLGLKGCIEKKSTDNISFTPGIGVISYDFNLCKKTVMSLVDFNNESITNKIKVVIPTKGSIMLPDGRDMHTLVSKAIEGINDVINVEEKIFDKVDNRNDSIKFCNNIFEEGSDVIITIEGPIDFYGYGDSVLGTNGMIGRTEQLKAGKYILKVANMINATSVTLPYPELSMGIVITAKSGIDSGRKAIYLGSLLKDIYKSNDLFKRYFIQGYKQANYGFI